MTEKTENKSSSLSEVMKRVAPSVTAPGDTTLVTPVGLWSVSASQCVVFAYSEYSIKLD